MNPWPISPVTTKDLDFAVVDYNFSGLTADSLSEMPGIENAIDLTLADFAASIAEQTSEVAVMFNGLDDLLNIIGEIDASPLDGVLAELANTASAGDATLGEYTAFLGEGSGGSGGSGPTSSGALGTVDFGDVPKGGSKEIDAPIPNATGQTLTIRSLSFTGIGGANTFCVIPNVNGTQIPPGTSFQLPITFPCTFITEGPYESTLQINTDGPDPQPTLDLKATVVATTAPAAGGSGSGDGGTVGGKAVL